ncbi:transcription termination factor NusA [Chrysiogenes arsenatis]|uniref:transcription termination factor NusA n=1 Tax=Chrysiogenes arsenatis TaxID=309797 RepID=UPI00040B8846|nr:transcription termination factor NusA [Chrysiogenes arsenatis]
MQNDFISSIEQLCREKSLDKLTLMEAIETAVIAALKRKYSQESIIHFSINEETGAFDVFFEKVIVGNVRDRHLEISAADAAKIDEDLRVGQTIKVPANVHAIGRITAQTAKQIILQKIRDVEKSQAFDDYSNRIGQLILCTVDRVENNRVILNLGECDGVMTVKDYLENEHFRAGQMIKAVIRDVEHNRRGGIRVYLSRTNEEFLCRLFEEEVPEVSSGAVSIKAAAREAGSRSKIAVRANRDNMDPIGACVGVRGSRVGAVVEEIGGEKIDIIQWFPEPAMFIRNALSPAKVIKIDIYDDENAAIVVVPQDQLSLAIGKRGQNARLAAKLTNWKIDIYSEEEYDEKYGTEEEFYDEDGYEDEAPQAGDE